MRPSRSLTLLLVTSAVALAGCGDGSTGAADSRALRVVATTPVVADFVRTVGADRVAVTQVLKPGVDPHDYEPSPADLQAIADADVVVENGVGLEAWLADTVAAAGFSGPVVDSSEDVTLRPGEEDGGEDPHVWHDPRNATLMVRTIADALAAADPSGAGTYERNAADYTAKLAALDKATAAKIASVPAAQRKLVTNHDAFGYYCARYGLTFVGAIIPSFDTSAELSGRQLSDLVTKIRATGVKAVFSEASLPPRTAETVAREAGVTVVGGEEALYADGLGPEGSPGGTYLRAEQHNTDTIVKALGGRV
ncbi:MAG TPA: metal ABC transporter substrate-binding protein [Mycobacteriales bacterium]|nr:metal ABC transporter substrate-binding protein [Mycobacteriales bacterium]